MQVVVGYVGTAFIIVAIITGYYLLGYEPELDPFRKDSKDGSEELVPFRPNPVDKLILHLLSNWVLRKPREANSASKRQLRLNISLVKVRKPMQYTFHIRIILNTQSAF